MNTLQRVLQSLLDGLAAPDMLSQPTIKEVDVEAIVRGEF
jgi:hypothetical protein